MVRASQRPGAERPRLPHGHHDRQQRDLLGDYNGGLENVLRFQENWTGTTVTYRGSVIDLWYAEVVRGAWYGSYYTAPNRDWGYDAMYRSVPPGMTRVFGLEEIEWVDSSWDQVGWN